MGIVIEPSPAVPLAVILKGPDVYAGKRVCVIITGGNVDLKKLPWMQADRPRGNYHERHDETHRLGSWL